MSPTNNLPETEYTIPQQHEPINLTTDKTSQPRSPPTTTPHPTTRTRRRTPQHNPYINHHHQTRNDLQQWLTSSRCQQPSTTTPVTHPCTWPHPQAGPQTILKPESINEHWGDILTPERHPNSFRILSRNVNTLSPSDDFMDWKAAAKSLAEYSVTLACFQETNLQWSTPITKWIVQIFRDLPTKQTKVATSNSTDMTPSNYQPGGTCTMLMGPWITAAKLAGKDSSGMGRWSFIEIEGKEARRIVIISGYRSCNQQT